MIDFKDSSQWAEKVSAWRDETDSIPRLVHEEIMKSKLAPGKAVKGPSSLMYDPLSIQFAMGYKDRRYSLTYDVLKRIPQQLALIAAIIQTRCNQVASFAVPYRLTKSLGFAIKHKNPARLTTKGEREYIHSLEQFIARCGANDPNPHSIVVRDDFETFLKKIVRDSLLFDQVCAEVVPDRKGNPYEFLAVDASTIRIASNNLEMDYSVAAQANSRLMMGPAAAPVRNGLPFKTMQVRNPELHDVPAYVQLVYGQIRNTYTRNELIFGVRNPRSDIYVQGYGYGELEQLITIITAHLNAETYNSKFFTQGCVAGDTQVHTDTGIFPIESLVGRGFNVWNGHEFVPADVVASGFKRAIKTTLSDHSSITTSPEHQFLTLDAAGNAVMVPISELSVGDDIAQSDVLEELTAIKPLHVLRGEHHQCLVVDAGPATTDFFELVGWLVGDGWINTHSINKDLTEEERLTQGKRTREISTVSAVFGPKDGEMKDKIVATLKSYGLAHHWKKSGGAWGGTPIDTVVVRNKSFYEFLVNQVGVSTKKSHEKVVPFRLFQESADNRAAFLRGLFSADGCSVKNGKSRIVKLATSSKSLYDGVQQLLWSLGISSSLDHVLMNASGRPCYYLRVTDVKRFFSLVGFGLSYKAESTSTYDRNVGGSVPHVLQRKIVSRALDAGMLSGQEKSRARRILRGFKASHFSRPALAAMCTTLDFPCVELAYRWKQIDSIVDLGVEIPTFDVRQEHYLHQWSTGSCIVKNSAPKGILNFKGDNLTPDQLEVFKRQWRANVEGVESSWRMPIMQSEQGVEFINLHTSNQEMEYGNYLEYLIKISCAVFLIDPAELNFDMHGGVQQTPLFESSQEWKLKASRDRGLKPMLRFIAKLINDNIVAKLDDNFMFDFVGLDELTEQEKHELRKDQVSTYMTLNEIRRAEDLPDVVDGDLILNSTYTTAQQQRRMMAQQDKAAAAQQQPPPAAGAEGEAAAPGGAPATEDGPQYADSFSKSLKVLQINLDDESDSWIDAYRE